MVDIRIGAGKTKAKLKGWNSSKLITSYIKQYRAEWLPFLEPTESKKNLCFDNDAKERLIEEFPNDNALKAIYGMKKKERAIQQYTKLLKFADKDRFYPNYLMFCQSTGRFSSRDPEFHNFISKPVALFEGENPDDYNVRKNLLGDDNVFEIDFANQEDRVRAWTAKEPVDIAAFIAGIDPAKETAKKLSISRDKAKTIRHGLPYGRGVDSLKVALGISYGQAEKLHNDFGDKYAVTGDYIQSLREVEYVKSPILGRVIRFSQFKDYTRFNGQVQGGCVDLLLVALEYILDSKKVELRGHFHDGLYLACLCGGPHPGCKKAEKFKQELEALYPMTWPSSKEKVFKFGDVKWTA